MCNIIKNLKKLPPDQLPLADAVSIIYTTPFNTAISPYPAASYVHIEVSVSYSL
jgi:hypothetical protein